jgi:hypothetical protein
MTTILCATDVSSSSARVVATAAAMSRLYDADLELFHAVAIPPTYPPDVTDEQMVAELRNAAEAAVGAQAASARAGGLRVRRCCWRCSHRCRAARSWPTRRRGPRSSRSSPSRSCSTSR